MKLNELIGKQIFDIYDANFIGTIHDIAFNNNYTKILGVYFFDQEENEFFIKTQNIYAIGDYLTIKNMSKVSNIYILNKPLSPLGKHIVSILGTDYGNISDLEFNEEYKIDCFYTSKNEKITPEKICLISQNIIASDNVKISRFRPRTQKTTNIQNINVGIMKMPEEEPKKIMPSKITVNSDILLGKRISKDIFGKNNELIIKQNQILTQNLILLAKNHDKLNELFYSVY